MTPACEVPVFDVDRNPLESFVRQRDFRLRCHGDMRAGDATFHSGWTLHMAPPNQTAATREVMTVIYFADGTIVGPADNANRVADLETWLPGLRPGEPAASPLNPVLYTRR